MHMELWDKSNSLYQCWISLVYDLLSSSPVLAQSLHHIISHHITSQLTTKHTWLDLTYLSKMLSYNLLLLQLQYVVAPNLFICKIIMDKHRQCNAMQYPPIAYSFLPFYIVVYLHLVLHYTTLHKHNKYRM